MVPYCKHRILSCFWILEIITITENLILKFKYGLLKSFLGEAACDLVGSAVGCKLLLFCMSSEILKEMHINFILKII